MNNVIPFPTASKDKRWSYRRSATLVIGIAVWAPIIYLGFKLIFR
jgi:hypothetical protein